MATKSTSDYATENLAVYPYQHNSGYSYNGITFEYDKDGVFTVNGTATANAYMNIWNNDKGFIGLVEGEQYTVTLYYISGTGRVVSYFASYASGNHDIFGGLALTEANPKVSRTFTYSKYAGTTGDQFAFYVSSGNTCNNFKFAVQLEKGVGSQSYTPYNATNYGLRANADNLNNIIPAENMIDFPYSYDSGYAARGITFDYGDDGTIHAYGTVNSTSSDAYFFLHTKEMYGKFPFEIGKEYTLSLGLSGNCGNNSNTNIYLATNYTDGTNVDFIKLILGGAYSETYKTVVYTEQNKPITGHTLAIRIWRGTTVDFYIRPMLEKGNVVHEFTPFNLNRQQLRNDIEAEKATLAAVTELQDNQEDVYFADNLIPCPYSDVSGKVVSGLTYTYDDYGEITVNGTAGSSTSTFNLWSNSQGLINELVPGQEYTLTAETTAPIWAGFRFYDNNTDPVQSVMNRILAVGKTVFNFVMPERYDAEGNEIYSKCSIFLRRGTEGNVHTNTKIKIMIEEGSKSHKYRPYVLSRNGLYKLLKK